ncbi:hypothetical protein HQ865_15965 [Mucilaginibacter mali]|uniref:Histidine kinase domain-containing protein n=1 Tax=Mucilaginibacter mali TaxID=2740462 RepID=A0A7D4PUZ2_9SPHI|nr:sensor histidine kinase [Mucilaginibacter mali]QKJ31188.1 hypothetical protein HQ865_15965 [Mucilaginibacter mali]
MYTVNDGLPQSTVESIAQDRDGFMWFGTEDGLSRYDGFSFKTYRRNAKDPHSIIGDKSIRLHLDKLKQFWVITYNGLSLYHPETDNFISLIKIEPHNVITAENNFLGEDDSFIYAGICEYGVVKINKRDHRVSKLNISQLNHIDEPHSWYSGFVAANKLWIATNTHFVIYDMASAQTRELDIRVNSLVNINTRQALGVTSKGVVIIDKTTLDIRNVNLTNNGVEPNLACSLRLSDSVALLGSLRKGVYYFNINTGRVIQYIGDTGNERQHELSAWCFYIDRSGNTWIGTNSNGTVMMVYPYKKLRVYRSGALTNNINCVYADSDKVYAGNSGVGLNVFDKKTGLAQNINVHDQLPSVINAVGAIYPIDKNRLLMLSGSSRSNGHVQPYLFDKTTRRFKLLDEAVQQVYADNFGKGNFRYLIFRDAQGKLMTNVGGSLIELKEESSNFTARLNHRFEGESMSSWFNDNEGNLWIGTYKGVYRRVGDVWNKVNLPRKTEVKTITQDNSGNMWLGTNFGIYVMDRKQQVLSYYTEQNGLRNEHLYGMLKDNDGNIWFSHNKGISRYDHQKKLFRHLNVSDGLQSDEFNAGAYFKAPDGELLFGGVNGISAFYPRQVLNNPHNPQPNITRVLLFDKPYQTDTASPYIRKLTLPYTANSLSFEFSLPEYTDPQRNQYAYIMENMDRAWIYSGNNRFTRYAGLQPGHYYFKVKAANNDGVWGAPAVLDITIIPPVWRRGWFVLLEALAGVSLIALAASLIQRNTYRKKLRAYELQQKIQLERERISRDLHDNIGTQLSLINKSIREITQARAPITDEEKNRKLDYVHQGSKEVIDVLRETIWALNKHEVTLEEFADNLKMFIQKKLKYFPGMDMEFTEKEDNAQVQLSSTGALNLFRICQEAVTNSIKYAQASLIKINVTGNDDKYQISISDDGIGFDPAQIDADQHYGLQNMEHRASEIGCSLEMSSVPGKGTMIIITKK